MVGFITFSGVFVFIILLIYAFWFLNKYFVVDDTKEKKIQKKKQELETIEILASEIPEVDEKDLKEKQEKVDKFIN